MYDAESKPLALDRTESDTDFSGIQICARLMEGGGTEPCCAQCTHQNQQQSEAQAQEPWQRGLTLQIVGPPNGKGKHVMELKV